MDFWDLFLILFIFIPMTLLWGFAIFDIFRRHDLSGGSKVLWIVVIFILPVFGTLIYVLLRPEWIGDDAIGRAGEARAVTSPEEAFRPVQ